MEIDKLSLEELIFECGDEFARLSKFKDGWYASARNAANRDMKRFCSSKNKSPKEAVINVILSLKEDNIIN